MARGLRTTRTSLLRKAFAGGFVLALGVWTPGALAQSAGDSGCTTAACGKERFQRGVEAYQAGAYAEAIENFRAALAVKRHPSILLNLGLAEIRAGQLMVGIGHLREVETDAEAKPEMRKSARDERLAAEAKTAWVQLDAGDGVELEIDGQPAELGARGTQLDPGKHQLKLTRGSVVLERPVELSPGETLRVSFDRARELVLVMPAGDGRSRDGGASQDSVSDTKPLSPIWFYAGLGATVVVGGLATWSALDTQSAHDAYEQDLPRLTQGQINQRVDDGHALERRTNWLLAGTAFAGIATGILAGFFVDWGGGGARTGPHARVAAGISPDASFLAVSGGF